MAEWATPADHSIEFARILCQKKKAPTLVKMRGRGCRRRDAEAHLGRRNDLERLGHTSSVQAHRDEHTDRLDAAMRNSASERTCLQQNNVPNASSENAMQGADVVAHRRHPSSLLAAQLHLGCIPKQHLQPPPHLCKGEKTAEL